MSTKKLIPVNRFFHASPDRCQLPTSETNEHVDGLGELDDWVLNSAQQEEKDTLGFIALVAKRETTPM